jgi:hypothetical protein
MSFVSSNNCTDSCLAGFDGANVLGSEKRAIWWIYNGSAIFKWKLNYINNFKSDLLQLLDSLHYITSSIMNLNPSFQKNPTNKPIA